MATRIRQGDVEPIQLYVVNGSGLPLTGKTDIYIQIRRDSDGYFLDWNDYTFKNTGWTTLNKNAIEVDAVNSPGLYDVSGGFATGSIINVTADENYIVFPLQTPGTDARLPIPEEIKVDQWIADIASPTDVQVYESEPE